VRRWRELVADRKKMEGHCSTGQSPQWAVVCTNGRRRRRRSLYLDLTVILYLFSYTKAMIT